MVANPVSTAGLNILFMRSDGSPLIVAYVNVPGAQLSRRGEPSVLVGRPWYS
jgi:hypothetical protein